MPESIPTLINRTAVADYRVADGRSRLVTAGGREWLAANATELKLTVSVAAAVTLAGLLV